jgi:hypothetical protein
VAASIYATTWADLMVYSQPVNERTILGRDVMIKLSNYDGQFVVRLLELRRAAILEMMQQLPEQSCKERAAELRRLDAVLTQIKAELPQTTDPEIAEAIKLVRSL